MTVEEVRAAFGVKTDKALGEILNKTEKAISAWRRNGVPSSIAMAAEQKMRADNATSRRMTSTGLEVERIADYILTKAGMKEGGKLIHMEGRGKRKAA